MSNLNETTTWEPGIYQLEEEDLVQGGPDGIDNVQAKQLANRTAYLKQAVEGLSNGKQPLDDTLTAIAALVGAADRLAYFTGNDALALTAFTAVARTLLAAADAATMRTTLGLGTIATLAADTDGTLATASDTRVATQKAVKTYVDLLFAANDAMVFKGVIDCATSPNYPAADNGHTYRVSVAGKIGGAAGINVEVGDILLCAANGTAAGNQATVGASWGIIQANLDGALLTTAIGTTVQAYDQDLAAIAALVSAANKMPYATGAGAWALADLTAFARTLLDDADADTARATLGAAPLSGAVPTGTVIHVTASSAPAGYLKANGAAIPRTTYAQLFAAIGTTFGVGNGSTTFNLPDLRGEFIRCFDDGRGIDSGRGVGTAQGDDIKSHAHTGGSTTSSFQNAAGGYNGGQVGVNTGATGGAETRPRNIALLACIKY